MIYDDKKQTEIEVSMQLLQQKGDYAFLKEIQEMGQKLASTNYCS